MPWSTREIAALAGTTVNTVRHYHDTELLEEPERHHNGYKQYGAPHLVRLLHLRRLRDLGVPITEIERIDAGVVTASEVLTAIDAQHAETIERSQRARVEIEELLRHGSITEVPTGFAAVAPRLSSSERSLLLIYSQLYQPEIMADILEMVKADDGNPTMTAFDSLPADADAARCGRLVEDVAESIATAMADYPWLTMPGLRLRRATVPTDLLGELLRSLFNPAQLEVLAAAATLALERSGAAGEPCKGEAVPSRREIP